MFVYIVYTIIMDLPIEVFERKYSINDRQILIIQPA